MGFLRTDVCIPGHGHKNLHHSGEVHRQGYEALGNDSGVCDIYSTYLYLLPVDVGLELVNNTPGIEAIWYIDSNNIIRSDGFNYE